MLNIIKDITTIKNGRDYDSAKVMTLLAFLAFIGLSIYAICRGEKFDPLSWCGGASGLIFGGSAGCAVKAATEPQDEPKGDNS